MNFINKQFFVALVALTLPLANLCMNEGETKSDVSNEMTLEQEARQVSLPEHDEITKDDFDTLWKWVRFSTVEYIAAYQLNKINQIFALTQEIQYNLNNFQVGIFIVSANIIDLAVFIILDDHVDCAAVVQHKKPVAHIQAVAVNR